MNEKRKLLTRLPDEVRPQYRDQLVTLGDLAEFRHDLLKELYQLLQSNRKPGEKEWLKSKEAAKLLGLSNNTLLNLRKKGILPFIRVGGQVFYNYLDIQNALNDLMPKTGED